jgi:hypothetical protein
MFDAGGCKPSPLNAHILTATVRGIQPQVRVQIWRFMLQLQVGFELRLGQIQEDAPMTGYDGGGFMIMDVLIGARAGARFYVYDGLFLWGQYHWAFSLASPLYTQNGGAIDTNGANVPVSSGEQSFNGGIGYAF